MEKGRVKERKVEKSIELGVVGLRDQSEEKREKL